MNSDFKDTQMLHPARAKPLESQQRSFGRSTSATALWGHLLQKNLPSPLLPQLPRNSVNSSENPPLAPNDKLGTSMRMLLHDTQAIMEKFSERVEKLTSGVDKAQQDISAVQRMFEHERENTMSETVALVNRCQLEIQKSLGKPAQAHEVEELRKTFVSVDRRLEALDKRFDVLHLLNQTQSQTLQAIQEQQVSLLSSLVPILPLLQSIPLHIDTAKVEIKDTVKEFKRVAHYARDASRSRTTTSSSETLTAPPKRLSGILPMSSPASYSPSKRRRVELSDDKSQQENRLFSGRQESSGLLSPSKQSQYLASCSASPGGPRLSSPFTYGRRLDQSSSQQSAMPATSPVPPRQDRSIWSSPARAAQLDLPATPRQPRLSKTRSSLSDPEHSPRAPCDRPTSPQTKILVQHETSVNPQLDSADKDTTVSLIPLPVAPIALDITASVLSERRSMRRSRTPTTRPVPLSTELEPSLIQISNDTVKYRTLQYNPGPRGPPKDLALDFFPPIRGQMPCVDHLMVHERTALYKPISLKDRRARGLLTDVTIDQGKRYIVVEEEDEEDDELAE